MAPDTEPFSMANGGLPPTSQQFRAYEAMFDHFNRELWDGRLPPVLLNFSRHAGTLGFFAPERWQKGARKRAARMHEISINPAFLLAQAPRNVASTLVHEMVHQWQQEFGTPSRAGYHNKEWAAEMKRVGLQASSTGHVGGSDVGQRMSHYIIPGGAFARAFERMPEECKLPLRCSDPARLRDQRSVKNKVKYTCLRCGANAWGRPNLAIACISDKHKNESKRMVSYVGSIDHTLGPHRLQGGR